MLRAQFDRDGGKKIDINIGAKKQTKIGARSAISAKDLNTVFFKWKNGVLWNR